MADALSQGLAGAGFAFVPGSRMRALLEARSPLHDWPAFAASWEDLPLDLHMADQGRYRRRRHAVYSVTADGKATRLPAQPHFQSIDYNPLNGGVERMFEPVDERLGRGPSVRCILAWCAGLFGSLGESSDWRVEMHQFRIEAFGSAAGQPTPEGMHRDGVDFVLVLLVRRHNIDSGTTMISSSATVASDVPADKPAAEPAGDFADSLTDDPDAMFEGSFSGSFTGEFADDIADSIPEQFTLADPFDAALVDDHRVLHGVTPVRAHDPARPGYRDVLVVTFKRANAPAA